MKGPVHKKDKIRDIIWRSITGHCKNFVIFKWDVVMGENSPHVLNFEIMLWLLTKYLPAIRNEEITSRD